MRTPHARKKAASVSAVGLIAVMPNARNTAVRDYSKKWFADRGMKPTDSQANFVFIEIGRPAKGFREACAKKGVLVARDFPPFEKTHCRLSFGTMDEMKKATAVFEQVLAQKAKVA